MSPKIGRRDRGARDIGRSQWGHLGVGMVTEAN
jgi:hypothetical protein